MYPSVLPLAEAEPPERVNTSAEPQLSPTCGVGVERVTVAVKLPVTVEVKASTISR